MTLEQLRVFIAVAERQHVTRAAEALHLAQSAVSASIAALEERYGVILFQRVGRGIALTQAGALFLIEAKAVVARAEKAERLLADLCGLKRGALILYASQTIASYWLPHRLVAFQRTYPGIELTLEIGNTAQVAKAVREGAADMGFVEGPVSDALLASTMVARDQLVIVVAPDHPWANAGRLTPQQLSESVWIMREKGSGTRALFEDAAKDYGILEKLHIALVLPSNEAVRGAVEAGMGAAALSASVVSSSIEAGLLTEIAFKLPERGFYALQLAERAHNAPEEALRRLLLAGASE